MAHAERITISVSPEMAAMLRREVESGEYSSTSEVAREALREWSRRRSTDQRALTELRALIQEGIDSGPGAPGDQVFGRLRARYADEPSA